MMLFLHNCNVKRLCILTWSILALLLPLIQCMAKVYLPMILMELAGKNIDLLCHLPLLH